MATYAHGTESLSGSVPGQPISFLDGCVSHSTQETGSTSLELCKHEKRQTTDEEDRNRSLALIQRISERHLIKQQESRFQPRSRELQQYLDVLKDATPRLPDNNLTPGPEMPTITFSRPRLAYPIVIKQRLSRTMLPKFTPTYPPGLQNCGIEKREFLRFIDDLNRVEEQSASPRDLVMDINGFANMTASTTARPTLLSMAIGVASSYRKHTTKGSAMTEILQKANNELFRPKGLVCVLVTCRRTEPKEPERTPETGGTAASTEILDRTLEKRLKSRPRVVGRLRYFRWSELSQFGFYDEHNPDPDLDSHRLPARHSYRSRRRRSPSIEREAKTGLRQVVQENCENGNIGESRQRQSTLKCGVSKHPVGTEDEPLSLSGNKTTSWDFVSNQSSRLGLIPGEVEVESLTADFFTAETDEDTTREEAQQTDSEPEHTSTGLKHRIYSRGKALSSDALCLMILNSPEQAKNTN
ncbi:hypothetical protein HER10_EVM0013260 [Colletotrichum scovillei]|uniref:FAD binding domain protein n=1 Tax=Colletotrichum scovillei TaxID=1209932 RepID=A0A9P7RKR5_9PEZI|nr:uncharacterized protein HER10_EVM0013260 [Colletotrichum scovillei]KAF4778098.1 hypothetical protein HER10_EVM0013260 [Colletotrichum scovillei]KAG7059102.1 FAD binding domain protein [Colletotrichum scovillei]KAG7077708.1 FAD binding domain protein [Colletotrichum scovillei]KAG7084842.1 FAD binding domain protein [Colletotrichum scovillei]